MHVGLLSMPLSGYKRMIGNPSLTSSREWLCRTVQTHLTTSSCTFEKPSSPTTRILKMPRSLWLNWHMLCSASSSSTLRALLSLSQMWKSTWLVVSKLTCSSHVASFLLLWCLMCAKRVKRERICSTSSQKTFNTTESKSIWLFQA